MSNTARGAEAERTPAEAEAADGMPSAVAVAHTHSLNAPGQPLEAHERPMSSDALQALRANVL